VPLTQLEPPHLVEPPLEDNPFVENGRGGTNPHHPFTLLPLSGALDGPDVISMSPARNPVPAEEVAYITALTYSEDLYRMQLQIALDDLEEACDFMVSLRGVIDALRPFINDFPSLPPSVKVWARKALIEMAADTATPRYRALVGHLVSSLAAGDNESSLLSRIRERNFNLPLLA